MNGGWGERGARAPVPPCKSARNLISYQNLFLYLQDQQDTNSGTKHIYNLPWAPQILSVEL